MLLAGMYYVEILGYRHFPDLLRVRGGWQYTYMLSMNSWRGITRSSALARAFIFGSMWIRILYGATNIFQVISKRQNGGVYIEKFRAIFESRKLMPQVVNNPPMWLLPPSISIMDIMKRRCKRRSPSLMRWCIIEANARGHVINAQSILMQQMIAHSRVLKSCKRQN